MLSCFFWQKGQIKEGESLHWAESHLTYGTWHPCPPSTLVFNNITISLCMHRLFSCCMFPPLCLCK